MPFGNFACLTIAIFSPFPEVLKQKTQTHGSPQDPTGLTLSTLPISAHSLLLWAHLTAATLCPLFCDTAKFFPASRPLHLLFPAFSYAQYLEGLWMCGQIAEPHRGLLGRQGSFQPMGSPRSCGRHGQWEGGWRGQMAGVRALTWPAQSFWTEKNGKRSKRRTSEALFHLALSGSTSPPLDPCQDS